MATKKIITNVKLMNDYMDYGSPMNQAFVIQAMNEFAKVVISQKKQLIKQMEHSAFNPHAWIKCAEDWQKAYQNQQENNK